ncbi:uncharacterized protein DS421_17g584050 [Arachis hypogaea]|nr:uncharacterized protein DS421_17g584050 [Arachis hypogaea]
MATSSHHLSTSPHSSSRVAICDKPIVKNGKDFAPEPEASKSKIWESQVLLPLTVDDSIPIGYFDSNNRLFRNPPKTNIEGYHAWLGALYFWDETSHTFHTPYGMITPTLLDVAAITGLPPLGEKILTTTRSTTGVEYAIDISFTTYQSFILNNKGQDGEAVSNNEHIAFLLYWLSGVIFCARSIQVEITYLPLAIMLAEGPTDSLIAGHRLLNLIFSDKLMASHDKMKHFFRAFYYLPEKDHNINLIPFANCQTGPEWLTQSLTPTRITQKESITIWSQFLTPQLLFAGFPGEDDLRTTVYMPNAVSRQFGLAQAIPSPYHLQDSQSLHVKATSLEDLLHIQKDNTSRRHKFHLFPFKSCQLTTYSFFSWWKTYYSSIKVAFSTCCQRMTTVLVMQQHNEVENENTSSSDKSVSKFSSGDDVDALSPSDQLASQVTVALTISLIVPSTENMMAVTSDKPTPKANANKLQNSKIPPSERSEKQIPITSRGEHGSVWFGFKFKAQLSDILQTFSTTPHPETIDPLLAHMQKVYEDLYAKFPDYQAAISSYQQLTESLSKLKQDTSSFETAKATLDAHIIKAKDRAHELSEEIRDLEQQLTVKRGVKNRLDAALIKNEAQFAKASSMLDSSNAALQSLEEKMPSSQEAAKEARNFQTALQAEVTRLKEIFET